MSLIAKAKKIARDPVLRPFEIWLIRAAVAAVATWLGIDLSHILA